MEIENELAEKLDLDLHLERDEYQKEAEIKERQLSDMREKLDEQLKDNKKLLEELQVKEAEIISYKEDFKVEVNKTNQLSDAYMISQMTTKDLQTQLIQLKKTKEENEQELKSQQQLIDELRQQVDSSSKESLQQSNQKLVNELTILRQQLDSLTASRESLLTAYNQEQAMVTSLQHQLSELRRQLAETKKDDKPLQSQMPPATRHSPHSSPNSDSHQQYYRHRSASAATGYTGCNTTPRANKRETFKHLENLKEETVANYSSFRLASDDVCSSIRAIPPVMSEEDMLRQFGKEERKSPSVTPGASRITSDQTDYSMAHVPPMMTAEEMNRLYYPKNKSTFKREEQRHY